MQKNAIFLFSGVIALTSAFLLFAMDLYKEANKPDASFMIKDACFNLGVQVCLICLPIISALTFLLSKREAGNFNESILRITRVSAFIFALVDLFGIHCIISPIRIYWYGKLHSLASFSWFGFVISLILFLILNNLSKKVSTSN